MSEYIRKSHNVSVLLYHLVCPTQYRRAPVTEPVEATLRSICRQIENCLEITFVEIGADQDHVHFLLQSVPKLSPARLVQIIKSITTGDLSRRLPGVKKAMSGACFWSSGYFLSTVGHHGIMAAKR